MRNIKGKFMSILMSLVMMVSILGMNISSVFADESSKDINVNITVVGMYNEILFRPQQVKVSENAKAEDVLKATGLSIEVKDNGMVDSIAGQKNGANDGNYSSQSGWMYKVNFTVPQVYPKEQSVKDGDYLLFTYAKNYNDLLPSYDSYQNDFVNVTVKNTEKDNNFSEKVTVLKNNSINAAIMEGLKKHGGDFNKSSLHEESLMSKDGMLWSYIVNGDKSTYRDTGIQLKENDSITIFKDSGEGPKEEPSTTGSAFTLAITKDNGATTLKKETVTIDKTKNAMDYLKSVAEVTELQGPGFINGIDGLLNVFLKDLPIEDRKAGYYGIDWFVYLNGSLTSVGATGVYPEAGDTLNFDYHKWDWHALVAPGTTTIHLTLEDVPKSVNSGDSIKLRVTCVYRGVYGVKVKVDNKEVATTDLDGYATIAIAEAGEHTIRIEKDDAYKEKKITVSGQTGTTVPVTGVALNKTSANLKVGEALQLTANILPNNATNKKVAWSTSDKNIASVDENGKVTAIKEGTVVIKVTTEDGQQTAVCNVTIGPTQTKDYTASITNLIDGISSTVTIDNCSDWLTLGLNKSGKDVPKSYLSKLEQRVSSNIKNGVLNLGQPTEYEKLALAVLACGGDPTNIAGQNLIEKIYNNKDMSSQGINAYIFGLIALDSGNFTIPEAAQWTREKLINKILNYQLDDGGWDYGATSADPDMTAMAISSLAPYYTTNTSVKAAIDKAIDTLSKIQDSSDGGFKSYEFKNSESSAQVIIALCANGVNPTTDSRFIKNGKNPMDSLLSFAASNNKGFGHLDNKPNPMATEQGLEALAAYNLLRTGKGSLYSFVTKAPENKTIKVTNLTTASFFSLGEDAKVAIKAENNSDKDQNTSLIVALYDKNGKFMNYVCGEQTIKKGDSSILTGMIKLPLEGVYKLKAFVWDSMEAMNSFSEVVEIPVK